MSSSLAQRSVAEAIGTGFLVATVVGSGIMAQSLTDDVAVALLANSLATGAILVVLIAVLGPVSGAQFNPAITVVFFLRGELPKSDVLMYVLAQLLGGVAGAIVAQLMFSLPAVDVSTKIRSGVGVLLGEGVATMGLMLVILGGLRNARAVLPWLVGLYIVAAYWFTSSTSFANPAVTIARSLSNSFAGISPASVPGFILFQLLGAGIGSMFAWGIYGTQADRVR